MIRPQRIQRIQVHVRDGDLEASVAKPCSVPEHAVFDVIYEALSSFGGRCDGGGPEIYSVCLPKRSRNGVECRDVIGADVAQRRDNSVYPVGYALIQQ